MRIFYLLAVLILWAPLAHAQGTCPSGLPITGTHCFFIAASGLDTNNGTTESTPWLHAPGMPNCSNTCGSTTPAAGEGFVFRGGDTWHEGNSSASPYTGLSGGKSWAWSWAGTSGSCNLDATAGAIVKTSCIYIGIDQTWFTGGSWTRPKFFDDNTPTTVQPSSCTYANDGNTMLFQVAGAGYNIFDNLEFYGACWTTTAAGAMIQVSQGVTEVTNSYFHGEMMGAALNCATLGSCTGGDPDGDEFTMIAQAGSPGYVKIDHNVFDNSDGTCGSGACEVDPNTHSIGKVLGVGTEIASNVFYEVSNVYVGGSAPSFHDNFLYYIGESTSNTHGNLYEQQGGGSHDNFVYNNLSYVSPIGQGWDMNCSAGSYVCAYFNNVQYLYRPNFTSGVPSDAGNASDCYLLEEAGFSSGSRTYQFWNNTTVSSCQMSQKNITATTNFTNNHFVGMGTPGTISNFSTISTNNEVAGDIFQSTATATSQGYVAGNNYAPTSMSNATVGAGSNLTSTCSGLSNSIAAAACKKSIVSVTYNQTNHTANDGTGVARPSSGAWDAGAYQFSSTVCNAPTASPTSGVPPQTVTLSSSTGGCSIFYSTSGTATCSSTSYSGPISVTINPTTISAVTCQAGYTTGGSVSWTYSGSISTTPAPTTTPFVKMVTPGTWAGRYGADGYAIALGPQIIPSYASLSFQGDANWNWGNTTDPRGLMMPAGSTQGASNIPTYIASCWYAKTPWSVTVSITDDKVHPFTLYAVDFDSTTRCQTFTLSGAVTDSRQLCSFNAGAFLTWNISGKTTFTLTSQSGANSVVSGMFWN
jgi:hypothetical protein